MPVLPALKAPGSINNEHIFYIYFHVRYMWLRAAGPEASSSTTDISIFPYKTRERDLGIGVADMVSIWTPCPPESAARWLYAEAVLFVRDNEPQYFYIRCFT